MQTRVGSFVEASANIAIGFLLNFIANLILLPLFYNNATPSKAFWLGVIFTVISLARSFAIRRWFNGLKFGNRLERELTPEEEEEQDRMYREAMLYTQTENIDGDMKRAVD